MTFAFPSCPPLCQARAFEPRKRIKPHLKRLFSMPSGHIPPLSFGFCLFARARKGTIRALHQAMLAQYKSFCGEMSEWFKEHAWKVCVRFKPVPRVRIPLSPPIFQKPSVPAMAFCYRCFASMVAPSAPRDDRLKTPPGPEGSNGID